MIHMAQDLFDDIAFIGGNRMVTVSTVYMGTKTYDIDADGSVGYSRNHLPLLIEHLEEAISSGGGVIVREFSSDTFLAKTPKGIRRLPIKNLYGIVCGNGRAIGLRKDQVQDAVNTDASTGQPMQAESGVIYCDWPLKLARKNGSSL